MSRQPSPLLELTRVRVLLFLREPEALFWVFAFPLLLAVVLAFAFKDGDVDPSRVGVVGGGISIQRDGLDVEPFGDLDSGLKAVSRGRIDLLLHSEGGSAAPIHLHWDPTRPAAVTARLRLREHLAETASDVDGRPPPRPLVTEHVVDARGSRYIDYLFPGLIGMNILGTGLWGVAFFLVEQRQKKLLRRLLVTPMPRSSYLLSFVTSRMVFLVFELAVLVAFGIWVLDVPLDGSLLALVVLCGFAAASFAGLGLLVASRARRLETVSNLINLVVMPLFLGSGIFFSYERYPEALQTVCRLLPLTALNDGLRAVMLDGAGIQDLGPAFLNLAVWGLATYTLALRIFRWT